MRTAEGGSPPSVHALQVQTSGWTPTWPGTIPGEKEGEVHSIFSEPGGFKLCGVLHCHERATQAVVNRDTATVYCDIHSPVQLEPEEPCVNLLIEPMMETEADKAHARYVSVVSFFRRSSFGDIAPYIGKRIRLVVIRPLAYGPDAARDVFICFCRVCLDGSVIVADCQTVTDWRAPTPLPAPMTAAHKSELIRALRTGTTLPREVSEEVPEAKPEAKPEEVSEEVPEAKPEEAVSPSCPVCYGRETITMPPTPQVPFMREVPCGRCNSFPVTTAGRRFA